MDILKAIVPAAGQGLRFMPYAKAVPKEMLPLLDKPAIHYIAEEALATGVRDLLVVTGPSKWSIEDYFDQTQAWREYMQVSGRANQFAGWLRLVENLQFSYVRQAEPLGLGHAIWTARGLIGKEYFGVMLPDDLILSKTPGLLQLLRVARQERASVIAVQEVSRELLSNYGVIEVRKQITPNLFQVGSLVEKPDPKSAPSNLAVIGRYVLSHKIFGALDELLAQNDESELQLTDGIASMIRQGEKLFAVKLSGIRYDLGTPLGWIKATIGMATQDPRYAANIREFLGSLDSMDSFIYNQGKVLEHFDQ